MTLIEAIQRGKPFKRPNDKDWWKVNMSGWISSTHSDIFCLPMSVENIMATDYEIEEERITITYDKLCAAIYEFSGNKGYYPSAIQLWVMLKEKKNG